MLLMLIRIVRNINKPELFYFDSLLSRSLILVRRDLGRRFKVPPHTIALPGHLWLWGRGGAPSYNLVALACAAHHPGRRFWRATSQPTRAPSYCLAPLSGEAGSIRSAPRSLHQVLVTRHHTKPGSSTMQARLWCTKSGPSALQLLPMTALGPGPIRQH